MSTNVVVIDDHTLVREGVSRVIQAEPDLAVVGEASSVSDARTLLAAKQPDVMLVDVSLPDGSGLALVRAARAAHPRLGIVVLTMHNDDDTLLEALDAGATALVLKSASSTEVVDAVRRAATAPDSFTANGLAAALRRQANTTVPKLTPRETEVLERLVDGASVAEVSRELFMSESTVKTHVTKLYDKLGAHNRAGAIMAAVRLGLVKTEPDRQR